jgi:hypothetical protein
MPLFECPLFGLRCRLFPKTLLLLLLLLLLQDH